MNCYPCVRNGPSKSGRGDWIRTSDPLRPRQVRYQAALRPDIEEPLFYAFFEQLSRRRAQTPQSSTADPPHGAPPDRPD